MYPLIFIKNNERFITNTNYWDSEVACKGFVYVSTNAGTFRMLIPSQIESYLPDIKTGKHVIISKGFHIEYGREMYEFMFEDFTDCPYGLWICPDQLCLKPAPCDNGKEFKFLLYSKGLKLELELTAYYRIVETLPCFKPWK